MPDKLFFPLTLLLALALAFVAIDPMADRPPRGPVSAGGRNVTDITITGEELYRFLPGRTGGIEVLVGEDGTEVRALRLQRLASQIYENPAEGPHLVIAEDIEAAFAAKQIEVSFEARALPEIGASEFEANYSAEPGEESGWRRMPLTQEFETHSFVWTPPQYLGVLGYDFLGVRPVTPEKRRSMEIRSIRLRILPAG